MSPPLPPRQGQMAQGLAAVTQRPPSGGKAFNDKHRAGGPVTTHCGTCGLSGLPEGRWLMCCGVGGHKEPRAGPSGCQLFSEPSCRAALTSGLELYEKQHRVRVHLRPGKAEVGFTRLQPRQGVWPQEQAPG